MNNDLKITRSEMIQSTRILEVLAQLYGNNELLNLRNNILVCALRHDFTSFQTMLEMNTLGEENGCGRRLSSMDNGEEAQNYKKAAIAYILSGPPSQYPERFASVIEYFNLWIDNYNKTLINVHVYIAQGLILAVLETLNSLKNNNEAWLSPYNALSVQEMEKIEKIVYDFLLDITGPRYVYQATAGSNNHFLANFEKLIKVYARWDDNSKDKEKKQKETIRKTNVVSLMECLIKDLVSSKKENNPLRKALMQNISYSLFQKIDCLQLSETALALVLSIYTQQK